MMRPMPGFEIRIGPHLSSEDVLRLYEAVGWTAYTRDPETIRAGLRGSSFVAAAFAGERLVGLVRAVSDDATISYVQDVLVDPAAQRTGVGAALVAIVAARYAHVRQHVLLTDDEPGQRAFYEALGYREIRDLGEGTLRAFVRFG
jgi:GNAT superfamily N-acetyltransferase